MATGSGRKKRGSVNVRKEVGGLMLKPGIIQSLPELPAPLLTIYLDTNPTKQMTRGLKPDYLTRFESEAKLVAQAVPFLAIKRGRGSIPMERRPRPAGIRDLTT
jgi:hypothetical protein